jgi:hypothetical protein
MDTRMDEQINARTSDESDMSGSDMGQTAPNGNARIDPFHTPVGVRHPMVRHAVTPSTFSLDEASEGWVARARETRAVLESLRAKTPEEEQEQRETLEFLIADLNSGRAPYAKLFSDTDDA